METCEEIISALSTFTRYAQEAWDFLMRACTARVCIIISVQNYAPQIQKCLYICKLHVVCSEPLAHRLDGGGSGSMLLLLCRVVTPGLCLLMVQTKRRNLHCT